MRLFIYTTLALLAFAANSLLCRLALAEEQIEPIPFTLIRLCAAALLLTLLVRPSLIDIKKETLSIKAHLLSGGSLALYAICFSLAYISMDTGMGALVLFATIQIVLNIVAQLLGEKVNKGIVVGITLAFSGLVLLLLPGQSAPDISSAIIMMIAGIGWAGFVYSGRNSQDPLGDVALSFRWALILSTPLLFWADWQQSSGIGILLAVISGALASGLGYALWYKVLPQLGLQTAAQAQLVVPVFATIMGVVFLAEQISLIMILASALILIGITIAIRAKAK
jgi:drug/metabolite transporter (DMT)-like permease